MKRYRIDENWKLIPIGDTEDARESKQVPSQNMAIIEQGAVSCFESNNGEDGVQLPAGKSKSALREASPAGATREELEKARRELKAERKAELKKSFARLFPNASEKALDIMVKGR